MTTATEVYSGVDTADLAFLGLRGPGGRLDDRRCGPVHSHTPRDGIRSSGIRSSGTSFPLPRFSTRQRPPTDELPSWAVKALRSIGPTVSIASRGRGEPVAVRVLCMAIRQRPALVGEIVRDRM